MNTEQYIEQKATTIYSGGMNAVKVVAEKDALSAIGLARREMIDKACDYLRSHIDKDLTIYHNNTWLKRDEFIERLKKTMEERIMEANEVFYDVVRYWDDCDRKVLNSKPLTKQEASELYKQEFRPARYGSLYSWAIEIHK